MTKTHKMIAGAIALVLVIALLSLNWGSFGSNESDDATMDSTSMSDTAVEVIVSTLPDTIMMDMDTTMLDSAK